MFVATQPPGHGMLRRFLPTVLLLVGASALLLATDRAGAARNLPAIGVLQQTSSSVLEDAVRGMVDGLAERGWVDGSTCTILRYNAEGDIVQANAIAREIVGGPFDLALTSSTPSLQAVANANRAGRVRHVFAAVADPFSAGVGLDRSDPRRHPPWLVGYGSLAPVDYTFGLARQFNPRLARVGAVHNPSEPNSRRFMELCRAACRRRRIVLEETPVENAAAVVEAVKVTLSRGVEAMFVPGDTTVISAIDAVITASSKAGVPVFTVNPGAPDRGSLFDVGFDFHEVGLAAGRLAADLLDGVDPATIPIRETQEVIPPRLLVNTVAPGVDRVRWRIPDDILRQAAVVVDADGVHQQPGAALEGPFVEPPDERR
jgi:putative ABC transport system substrate-binding protein